MRITSRRKLRGEETAPGLWMKVQVAEHKRKGDQRITALLCLGSNHSNRKPCPGKQQTVHTCKDAVHVHSHAHQRAALREERTRISSTSVT